MSKDILIQANKAIVNGDYEGFLNFCTVDTSWEFIGDATLAGKAEVLEGLKKSYLEPPRLTVDSLIEEDDKLVAVGEVFMTAEDGTSRSYQYADVWTVRDGLLHELKAFVVESSHATEEERNLIKNVYHAFNSRDIDAALKVMHKDVEWPKAFEGGYVQGPDAIRGYWSRQWTEINPHVYPVAIDRKADGRLRIKVKQVVKDLQGSLIFDGFVVHEYLLQDGKLRRMDIGLES